MKKYKVDMRSLTNECWDIQFRGREACDKCDLLNTKDCGGKKIRETGFNSKGYKVPCGVEENV